MELSISSALSFDGECTPSASRTSTLTRGMSLMGDRELELLCMQEFGKCDGDGDGIITQKELQEQCGDDPELAKMLMEAMDSDNDGLISFEDFRSSMLKVKTQLLTTPAAQSDADTSTPAKNGTKHGMSNFLAEESVFESDPSTNECEEEWFKAMERIDPAGLVSSNTELKSVWVELMMRDPALLDQFESFLTEIINTLEQKQEDCLQVEQHIRKVLSNHSRQVLEMDDVLQDRLREASYLQRVEIEERHRRLSNQYQGLIQDKDEAILQLAKSEEALRRELNDHSQSEQELRREKEMLLKLNKYLKDQLKASHKKLSLSQGLLHRLRHVSNGDVPGINDGSLVLDEDPLPSVNGSLTFSELPLSPTSSSYSLSYPQSSVLAVENVLPLDQEVRRALLSEEEEALLPGTPIQEQPQDRAGMPTLCTPQMLTESIEETAIHSLPVQNLPGYSPSKQVSLLLAQPEGGHGVPHSPEQARPRPTYLYKTLPTEGLPSQSELERQLQANLIKYAQKQTHAESSERREEVHLRSPQGAIQCVHEDDGLSSSSSSQQQQQVPPVVMVNGDSQRSSLSSVSSDDSDQSCLSWSFIRETNTSSEKGLDEYVLVQQNSADLQHGCPERANPSNQHGPSGVAKATKEEQTKESEEHTSSSSQKDVSVASSLESSLANKPASPPSTVSPSTVSHLKPTTNQTHSPTSWAGQPTIGINMGTPSVSLSTFITHRDDLPSPSTVTPNRIFKVMFLGDSGVGKTSIIRRLSQGVFTANVRSTIGLDFAVAVIQVGEEPVAFQLWDTAGQERFQATTGVYLRRADAFVIVYDVTNKTTFKSVRRWMTLVKAVLRNDLPAVMIMGNKSDCCLDRLVTQEEGHKLALELSTLFSETSALSGDNVLQSQTTLASLLLERQNSEIDRIRTSMFQLDKTGEKKRCGC